jgi:thiamine pyrophosphate-dependent acetolactate synthase large subunit-like protein
MNLIIEFLKMLEKILANLVKTYMPEIYICFNCKQSEQDALDAIKEEKEKEENEDEEEEEKEKEEEEQEKEEKEEKEQYPIKTTYFILNKSGEQTLIRNVKLRSTKDYHNPPTSTSNSTQSANTNIELFTGIPTETQ